MEGIETEAEGARSGLLTSLRELSDQYDCGEEAAGFDDPQARLNPVRFGSIDYY